MELHLVTLHTYRYAFKLDIRKIMLLARFGPHSTGIAGPAEMNIDNEPIRAVNSASR